MRGKKDQLCIQITKVVLFFICIFRNNFTHWVLNNRIASNYLKAVNWTSTITFIQKFGEIRILFNSYISIDN